MGSLTNRLETWALLQPIFDSISKEFTIDSVETIESGVFKLNTCNTLWLTKDVKDVLNEKFVTIGSVIYTLVDVDFNKSITVKGSAMPTVKTFDIPEFFRFRGTILAQNALVVDLVGNEIPMIWMHNPTPERDPDKWEEIIERESACDIYFFDQFNKNDWRTEDHFRVVIRAMRNLAEAFVQALRDSPIVYSYEGLEKTIIDLAEFGVYGTSKENVKEVFDMYVSGCQLKIKIPFIEGCSDCSC